MDRILIKESVLICPRNDEESLMILKLAQKLGLPTVVSQQPHGAVLKREKKLLARIQEANPDAKRLVIVELPGPEVEKELEDQGFEVVIIDHHRYDGLDRMQEKSSLEQFMDLFGIGDDELTAWGFDPKLVSAVGAIDRGFLWELKKEGIVGEEKKRVIEFYKSLTNELGIERRQKEEAKAREAWEKREVRDGVTIVKSDEDLISIRDAVSFIVSEEFDEPQPVLILQGDRRMYLQDSDRAKALYDRFGGFTFGKDRCWGILSEERKLPSVDEVLSIIVK
ncbi:hypothetical protein IH979_00985 [Patescibacteria group bacterium]|nr:hypothetical protein [Patescibacteria group bacterium]